MSTARKVANRQKQQKTLAEEFQNVYTLSKTLRFELKPVNKTKEILEIERKDKENFKKDRKIAKNYKKLKVLLDDLHQEFIQDVMNDFNFDLEKLKEFEKTYLEFLNFKDKDNYKKKQQLKNAYEKLAKSLVGEISKAFKKYNKEKYGSKFTLKNLLGEKVFDYLENKYKNDTYNLSVIRTFKFKPTQEEKSKQLIFPLIWADLIKTEKIFIKTK